jgi:hypothetical protein
MNHFFFGAVPDHRRVRRAILPRIAEERLRRGFPARGDVGDGGGGRRRLRGLPVKPDRHRGEAAVVPRIIWNHGEGGQAGGPDLERDGAVENPRLAFHRHANRRRERSRRQILPHRLRAIYNRPALESHPAAGRGDFFTAADKARRHRQVELDGVAGLPLAGDGEAALLQNPRDFPSVQFRAPLRLCIVRFVTSDNKSLLSRGDAKARSPRNLQLMPTHAGGAPARTIR